MYFGHKGLAKDLMG